MQFCKTMITLNCSWTAQRGGGLFVGLRLSLPRTFLELTVWSLALGLLVATVEITVASTPAKRGLPYLS